MAKSIMVVKKVISKTLSGLIRRSWISTGALLGCVLAISSCGGGGGAGSTFTGGPTPTPVPVPSPTPTPTPVPFAGVSMRVENATVPPGGLYQYQLTLTEPKPIGHGSTRPQIPTGPIGVAINDPAGKAVGVAVVDPVTNAVDVNFTSPNFTFGTDITYPLITMAIPVSASTLPGTTFPVSMDTTNSFFFDGAGTPYLQEFVPGTLTIGGNLSITNVLPGAGLLAGNATISVIGMGFKNGDKVQIEGTTVPLVTNFVSTSQLDVALAEPNPFQLDGERVRVVDKDTNEVATYFSYMRTDDSPVPSSNSLAAKCHSMFSRQTYTQATLPLVNTASQFTGISLQNGSTTVDANIKVELLDGSAASLASITLVLPAHSKITRDVIKDFALSPAGAVSVRITSAPAVQMLGLLGDTSTGKVTPVVVTP